MFDHLFTETPPPYQANAHGMAIHGEALEVLSLMESDQLPLIFAVGGKGAPNPGDMEGLIRGRVDLYITGEPHEWNRELFREAGISFFAGGHYNTEKLGVLALGDVIRDQFDLEVEFLDLPNEV